jgi:lipid A disaccharide synthetase
MKKVLIVAGEASGDLHGSNLVQEVKKLDPAVSFFGVGSTRMAKAGVEMLADASRISVVGATEVLAHLKDIYRVYARIKRFLREDRPSLVILIDFPDFNFLVGKAAKKLGIPVLYYISPQVWAWRKGRVKTMAGFIRAIMVALPSRSISTAKQAWTSGTWAIRSRTSSGRNSRETKRGAPSVLIRPDGPWRCCREAEERRLPISCRICSAQRGSSV